MSLAVPAWLGKPSPLLVDAGVAAVAGLPVMVSAITNAAAQDRTWLGLVVGLAAVLPLLARRRRPFAALAVILAVAVSSPVDAQFGFPIAAIIYTIGSRHSWPVTFAAAASVIAAGLAYQLAGGSELSTGDLVGTGLLCAITGGAGLYAGGRRASFDALSERAERLDRERELLAERAVAQERLRIAQELHDVVAHNVSLIVVQAQALGATVGDERVAAATQGIADLGRQAMAEMHRTLKLLRADGHEAAARAPQPGLADLERLLDRSRAVGLPVALAVEGTPRALAPGVDLSAYRILQEALTNVVKHAGPVPTTVTLGYRSKALELTITDSGHHRATAPAPGGHGLLGMRERAALFGGTLTAAPRNGHGFQVHARLPYGEAGPS